MHTVLKRLSSVHVVCIPCTHVWILSYTFYRRFAESSTISKSDSVLLLPVLLSETSTMSKPDRANTTDEGDDDIPDAPANKISSILGDDATK